MQSKEDCILFIGTMAIIGELDTKNYMLRGAMQLFTQVIPGMDSRGQIAGVQMVNEILPLFGITGQVTISLTAQTASAAIRLADLEERDATELAQKLTAARARLVEARAQKAGITLANKLPGQGRA